ncbi:MAG: hypothetical protein V1875_00270 [Candidatus Altiarchaeota archaeon]
MFVCGFFRVIASSAVILSLFFPSVSADAVDPNSVFGRCMTKYCWPGGESCDKILCPTVVYGCSIPCSPIYTNYGSSCVSMCGEIGDMSDPCLVQYADKAFACFSGCVKDKNPGGCSGQCKTEAYKGVAACKEKSKPTTTLKPKPTTTTTLKLCDDDGSCETGENCRMCERTNDCPCGGLRCAPGAAGANANGCVDPCATIKHSQYDLASDSCLCEKGYVMNGGKNRCDPIVTFKGRVTDGHGHPMRYMVISLEIDAKEYDGVTNDNGEYEFKDVKGLEPDAKNPPTAVLKAELSYVRGGKNYIVLPAGSAPMELDLKFNLRSAADMSKDMDFRVITLGKAVQKAKVGDDEYSSPNYYVDQIDHFSGIYYYLSDSVEFALTKLKANIDYKLPVEVLIEGNSTFYAPVDSRIQIGLRDASYDSGNRPKNREYHEFAHHIMYAQYGAWPPDRLMPGTNNHDGFINPSTADSYMEGFAEFMAVAMAEGSKDPDIAQPPQQYMWLYNLDNKYKPWMIKGTVEELAVAGILWDLHKSGETSFSIEEMWGILKVKRRNFYDYYDAFKRSYPKKADAIDRIFTAHGFFADKNKGNGVRDFNEPYRDADGNRAYDKGEYFIDYGLNLTTTADKASAVLLGEKIEYEKGEKIGAASNYERPNRTQAVEIPNAFIKVPDGRVRFYTVSIRFNDPSQGKDYDYTTEARQGLICLAPLPEDVDATYAVSPKSQDYSSERPYTITSREYLVKYYSAPESQGFFDQHSFDLKATGQHKDPEYRALDGVQPSWGTDGGPDVQDPTAVKIKPRTPGTKPFSDDNGGSQGCSCVPALTAIIALMATSVTKWITEPF